MMTVQEAIAHALVGMNESLIGMLNCLSIIKKRIAAGQPIDDLRELEDSFDRAYTAHDKVLEKLLYFSENNIPLE